MKKLLVAEIKRRLLLIRLIECFLGATYLTFGINAVKKILEKIVFPHIKNVDNKQFFDYKSKLQEYIQADTDSKLIYDTIKEEGKPNEKIFTRCVKLDNIVLGIGIGTSKNLADQEAAKNALTKLAK